MSTSIGIFTTCEQAENAAHELLRAEVPQDCIALLTPDGCLVEDRHRAKTVGGFLGGAIGTGAGLTLGLATATLVVPGVGPVLALGLGGATLLGVGGAAAGRSLGAGIDELNQEEHASDLPDARFFCKLLREGRSVIVVQTEDDQVHARASAVLNRLGMGAIVEEEVLSSNITTRNVSDILVISLSGRMIVGDSTHHFRELVDSAMSNGVRKILVNMAGLEYIDSSGIGVLVNAFLRMRKAGGQMKLTHLSDKVAEMFEITRLDKVMDIQNDEKKALAAFA